MNRKIKLTESQYRDLCDENAGICIFCHSVQESGVEPDARDYPCGICRLDQVYGIDELLLGGVIVFVEEGEKTTIRGCNQDCM